MELIDRKELLKAIERDSEGIKGQYGDEWLFLKMIESIPTIEVSEDFIDRYAVLAELDPQSVEYKIIKDLPRAVLRGEEL